MTEVQRSASGGGGGRSDFCFRAVSAPGQVPARARNQHERAPPPPERKQAETALLGSRLRGNDGEGSGNDEKGGGNEGNRNGRKERPCDVGRRGHGGAPAPLRCALGHRRAAKRRSEAAFGKGVKW